MGGIRRGERGYKKGGIRRMAGKDIIHIVYKETGYYIKARDRGVITCWMLRCAIAGETFTSMIHGHNCSSTITSYPRSSKDPSRCRTRVWVTAKVAEIFRLISGHTWVDHAEAACRGSKGCEG